MKAETAEEVLKTHIDRYFQENKLAVFEDVSFTIFHKAMQEYARAQIEKDRKRIVEAYYGCSDHDTFNDMIKKTPIILD